MIILGEEPHPSPVAVTADDQIPFRSLQARRVPSGDQVGSANGPRPGSRILQNGSGAAENPFTE